MAAQAQLCETSTSQGKMQQCPLSNRRGNRPLQAQGIRIAVVAREDNDRTLHGLALAFVRKKKEAAGSEQGEKGQKKKKKNEENRSSRYTYMGGEMLKSRDYQCRTLPTRWTCDRLP